MLLWVKKTTNGYNDVKIEGYRNSFRDGLAYAALCDKFAADKSLFDFANFNKDKPLDNLNAAFEFAEKSMGIPKLLDADEVMSGSVDERSTVLYISLFFHAFMAKEQQKGILVEKERIAEKMRGLEDSLEERARSAASLKEANENMTVELNTLRNQLQSSEDSKAELHEKVIHLEEKVDVLKQLLEQEHEEKTEIEQLNLKQEQELAELRSHIQTLKNREQDKDRELARLREELNRERSTTKDLSDGKAKLEEQYLTLQTEMSEMSNKFEQESLQHKQEKESFKSVNQTQVRGLSVLQKNLEEHIEDLHRWEKFLDLGEMPDFFETKTELLDEINTENYDEQLRILADRLESENEDLLLKLKSMEAEAKAKQQQDKKKKERQAKLES